MERLEQLLGGAGTFALDRLTAQALRAGAKVLLVGDFAQLGAVEAGGAFSMLVEDREMPAELSEVHASTSPGRNRPARSCVPVRLRP